jgi:hypothetical protein
MRLASLRMSAIADKKTGGRASRPLWEAQRVGKCGETANDYEESPYFQWCAWRELNPQPAASEAVTLSN